jgi:regulator of sigma E protease
MKTRPLRWTEPRWRVVAKRWMPRCSAGTSHMPSAPLPDSMIVHRHFGPVQALGESLQRAWDMTVLQAKMFARMIIGQVSLKNLSGPITIAEYAGDSARSGLTGFIGFLVLISLSLGFLNLLPIPMLDGGQIIYQTIEWI